MKKIILSLVIIIVAVTLFVISNGEKKPAPPEENLMTYTSEEYGLSFEYPDDYNIIQEETGNGERNRFTITLIKKEDAEPVENGEGPTAITIDIFQNNLDKQSLDSWFNTSASNGKLGDGTYASTTVSGQEAITYKWSGLYEGESTAFIHKENIIMISVTTLTPEDRNRDVYSQILSSLKLN